jgi:hypothetical protein
VSCRAFSILAPDVIFLGDGGGVGQVNGHGALIVHLDGELDTVLALRLDDGLITGIYAVRNPQRLTHMDHAISLCR